MKKIITILLIVSVIGLLSTGIAMSERDNPNLVFSELHSILSFVFTICFFVHVKTHFKSFINSFKS